MAKRNKTQRMTQEEWDALPMTFDSDVVARVFGCERRYVTNHAADEFGGTKVGGRWCFAKSKVAAILGIA